MSALVVVLLIILLLGGGGWGYRSRWSGGVFGFPDIVGILITLIVVVIVLRLAGIY